MGGKGSREEHKTLVPTLVLSVKPFNFINSQLQKSVKTFQAVVTIGFGGHSGAYCQGSNEEILNSPTLGCPLHEIFSEK